MNIFTVIEFRGRRGTFFFRIPKATVAWKPIHGKATTLQDLQDAQVGGASMSRRGGKLGHFRWSWWNGQRVIHVYNEIYIYISI